MDSLKVQKCLPDTKLAETVGTVGPAILVKKNIIFLVFWLQAIAMSPYSHIYDHMFIQSYIWPQFMNYQILPMTKKQSNISIKIFLEISKHSEFLENLSSVLHVQKYM